MSSIKRLFTTTSLLHYKLKVLSIPKRPPSYGISPFFMTWAFVHSLWKYLLHYKNLFSCCHVNSSGMIFPILNLVISTNHVLLVSAKKMLIRELLSYLSNFIVLQPWEMVSHHILNVFFVFGFQVKLLQKQYPYD